MKTRTPSQRLYSRLIRSVGVTEVGARREPHDPEVARNGLRIIGASSLQNAGDQVVNAGTVLPWLLASLGAPVGLISLLVPVREAGSMLPQAWLAPRIQSRRQRRWVWVAGAFVQAAAVAVMAVAAAVASGTLAGVVIVAALAIFALGRSLTSIAAKDVMARTIPKGQRGQINGIATLMSGVVAVTVGLAIRLLGGDDTNVLVLALLLGAAAVTWVLGAAVYAKVDEPAAEPTADDPRDWLRGSWRLLVTDAPFRRFVLTRTLLLVSALSPPFLVVLAAEGAGVGLGGLGPFVIGQGLARVIGGRFSGLLADRSSRQLMAWGALFASLLIVAILLLSRLPGVAVGGWLYGVGYFLLALIHTGVRVGRKTYVVDMAEPEQVTDYVAVSNTAMGVLLLLTGAVNAALATLGTEVALAFLALLGFIGVVAAWRLPEVGARA